jgi:hypothetical protein
MPRIVEQDIEDAALEILDEMFISIEKLIQ